ncbi:hypothetical protein GCM10018790_61030 [Kitasatospora xanthocidica]|uniref:hypothetical protein n=1 Tax=Kitasatospora xanthocidica TaxID=83382 RepID=UPI0016734265|nr:hypothetical protein [Kitasatospora xanthocidica]GHF74985.1 hypothetical protein GCM10018790_61030 [Kitasatospora xanthocidica]
MPERSPAEEGGKEERGRIDLSVAQVVASALAAVVGALLASELGVYGTIMGAAVVSIGATTGGAVFQHVFRRTGEQLREAVDRGPNQTVNTLRQVPAEPGEPAGPPVITAEWNEPQVVRARRRWGWKSYAVVSGLVFVLAMTPIVVFELATGQPVSATVKGESGNGTSFGGAVTPKSSRPQDAPPERPARGGERGADATPSGGASAPATSRPSREPSSTPSTGAGTASPSAGPSPSPSASPSAGSSPSAGGGQPTGGATSRPPVPGNEPAGATATPPPADGTPAS